MTNDYDRATVLPYTRELMRAYEALDLPFSAPMTDVTARFVAYLEHCRPSRWAHDPERLPYAVELTKRLTEAHRVIRLAWSGQAAPRFETVLPYDRRVAEAYNALDLPFSAPMADVTRRWRDYLKKCHPDRHASNPELLPDANRLTRILTEAHEIIRRAWEQYKKS